MKSNGSGVDVGGKTTTGMGSRREAKEEETSVSILLVVSALKIALGVSPVGFGGGCRLINGLHCFLLSSLAISPSSIYFSCYISMYSTFLPAPSLYLPIDRSQISIFPRGHPFPPSLPLLPPYPPPSNVHVCT